MQPIMINSTTKEDMLKIISSSKSISDVLRYFGNNPQGASRKTLYKKCKNENIDIKNLLKYDSTGRVKKYLLEDVLIENSYYSRSSLKKRILKEKLIECKCEKCGIRDEWQGEKLILVLDHINGIYNDHRLGNLRFLCPNCNSQMETFAGRNKPKKLDKTCIDCNTKIKYDSIRCIPCSKTFKGLNRKGRRQYNTKIKTKQCSGCQKLISDDSDRCIICSNLFKNCKNRKVVRPPLEILKQQTKEIGFVQTGKLYGVSDNAIRKWIKQYERELLFNLNLKQQVQEMN